MRQSLHKMNLIRERYQQTAVAIGLIILVVVVFAQDQANDDERFNDAQKVTLALRRADINRDFKSCQDTAEFRQTFAEFLEQSARPSSAGVDFTQLRTFADLDPETKAFLNELASVQSGGTSRIETIAEQYRERFFPLPDCKGLRALALKELAD